METRRHAFVSKAVPATRKDGTIVTSAQGVPGWRCNLDICVDEFGLDVRPSYMTVTIYRRNKPAVGDKITITPYEGGLTEWIPESASRSLEPAAQTQDEAAFG